MTMKTLLTLCAALGMTKPPLSVGTELDVMGAQGTNRVRPIVLRVLQGRDDPWRTMVSDIRRYNVRAPPSMTMCAGQTRRQEEGRVAPLSERRHAHG